MHKDKLTITLNIPVNESIAIQRIKSYFSKAKYEELYDQMPTMKFRRFLKSKNTALFLLKGFFLGGMANLDMNNRYSLARLVINSSDNSVNVKVSFEEFNQVFETYFTQEILQKEIESLQIALSEDLFRPITMDHPIRKYWLSFLKSVLILISSVVLFLGIFCVLLTPATTEIEVIITIVFSIIVVIGLNLLYSYWYTKRTERKVVSNINNKKV